VQDARQKVERNDLVVNNGRLIKSLPKQEAIKSAQAYDWDEHK